MEPTGQARIAQSVVWAGAYRDDAAIARALLDGEQADAVYSLSSATIVDTLFSWLGERGLLALLAQLRGVGIKREVIAFELFVLLYFLRCLARVEPERAARAALQRHLAHAACG